MRGDGEGDGDRWIVGGKEMSLEMEDSTLRHFYDYSDFYDCEGEALFMCVNSLSQSIQETSLGETSPPSTRPSLLLSPLSSLLPPKAPALGPKCRRGEVLAHPGLFLVPSSPLVLQRVEAWWWSGRRGGQGCVQKKWTHGDCEEGGGKRGKGEMKELL